MMTRDADSSGPSTVPTKVSIDFGMFDPRCIQTIHQLCKQQALPQRFIVLHAVCILVESTRAIAMAQCVSYPTRQI